MNFRTRFWDRFRKVMMLVVGGAFVFSIFQRLSPPPQGRLPKGMDVPEVALPYVSGADGAMNIKDFAGKSVIINFWATWCGPCREELPALQSIHERFAGEHLAVIGISDEEPREVAAFVASQGLTYPMVSDRSGVLHRRFKVRNIPFTVFVGPDGKVVGDYTGGITEDVGEEHAEELIELAREKAD